MDKKLEIAERIRELRLKHGLEQAQVADKMGYKSFTTISKWESGINLPNGGNLAKLAKLFGTTTDYILFGDSEIDAKISGDNSQILTGELSGTVIFNNTTSDTTAVEDGQELALKTQNALLKIQSAGGDVRNEILEVQKQILRNTTTLIEIEEEILGEQKKQTALLKNLVNQPQNLLSSQNIVSLYQTTDDEDTEYVDATVDGLVAAGHGIWQEENLNMAVRLRADDVPDNYDAIAKVVGDSMEPMIKDNDLLFIQATPQADINDIAIFQVDGKNYVKKLKRDYDGTWYLQSLNKGYEDIYFTEDDQPRTIGVVLDIYRD